MSEKEDKYTAPLGAGAKFDQGKAPIHRGFIAYFPRAIEAVSRVSEHGSKNHGWDTWHTVPGSGWRYKDAQARHMLAEAKGEAVDTDSGLLHLAHEAWDVLAVLELALKNAEEVEKVAAVKGKLTHCQICGDPLHITERWGNVDAGENFIHLKCTGCVYGYDKDVS